MKTSGALILFRVRLTLLAGFAALLAACAEIPAIEAFPPAKSAPPPSLLPLDEIFARVQAGPGAEARVDGLNARALRLQNRARMMQGPVHDPATRARLAEAIRSGRA